MDPSTIVRRLCSNCGTNATPMWRRSSTGETVCNACGIFMKGSKTRRSHKKRPKPLASIEQCCPPSGQYAPHQPQAQLFQITQYPPSPPYPYPSSYPYSPGVSSIAMNDVVLGGWCYNCGTTATPLWRRDDDDNPICNACGLFLKSHNYHRPRVIWSTIIKRRNRAVPIELQRKEQAQAALEASQASQISEAQYKPNYCGASLPVSPPISPPVSPPVHQGFPSHGYVPIQPLPQDHQQPWSPHTIPLGTGTDTWPEPGSIDGNIPRVKDIHCQPVKLPSIKFLLS